MEIPSKTETTKKDIDKIMFCAGSFLYIPYTVKLI